MRGYHPQVARAEWIDTDDSQGEQTVNVYGFTGERLPSVHRPQAFGFAGHAPPGSTGVVVSLGGERSKPLLFGGEDPDIRPNKLPVGTAVLYDKSGNIIFATDKSGIKVRTKNGQITVWPQPGKMVFLGGDPDDTSTGTPIFDFVSTPSGPSMNVKARIS